ncbi:nitroreductase [Peptoniphilus sp. GNH]|nr:nitroreductase [Peptoniphilus sp. GNH]
MVMTNFLQQRRSCRDFQRRILGRDKIEFAKKTIEEISNSEEGKGLFFKLFENGKVIYEALQGKAGYAGVMINAPHYIAMGLENDEAITKLRAGYSLEKLNSKITSHEVKTCWVTVTQVAPEIKKAIFGEGGEKVAYVIAMGLPMAQEIFSPEAVSSRKPLNEYVFSEKLGQKSDVQELENLGLLNILSSVRFAPSHRNSQPWIFLVNSPKVEIYTFNNREVKRNLVDLGVVMYYFEAMAKELGVPNKWKVVDFEEVGDYLKVAEITM